ncbi:hypothetical protein GCM10007890_19780 [Methylobacterium tardum]|uniref:Uncharacterized protein n=1 Tax=Methylobacterium tardum TaxID=374432 RepID=A0AA37TAY4_9HYPH|nr:hypothetical protein GCM10007890_19780 [Methylobacterium tardum]
MVSSRLLGRTFCRGSDVAETAPPSLTIPDLFEGFEQFDAFIQGREATARRVIDTSEDINRNAQGFGNPRENALSVGHALPVGRCIRFHDRSFAAYLKAQSCDLRYTLFRVTGRHTPRRTS